MIVLDAANKSLRLELQLQTTVTVTVSYWSIVSDVWTPGSFETLTTFVNTNATHTIDILPAPAPGETRVVENVWIHLTTVLGGGAAPMKVILDVGGAEHFIGRFDGAIAVAPIKVGTTLTLARDGSFTRQDPQFTAAGTNHVQNAH